MENDVGAGYAQQAGAAIPLSRNSIPVIEGGITLNPQLVEAILRRTMRGAHHNKAAVALITIMTFLGLSVQHVLAETPQIVEGSNVTFFYHITVPGEQIVLKDVGQFVQGQHQLLPVLERQVIAVP